MGAKKISVVDLSQEEEQVKTSRKRAKNLTALKPTKQKHEKKEVVTAAEDSTEAPQKEIKKEKKTKTSKAAKKKSAAEAPKETRSARYKGLIEKIDKATTYSVADAVRLAKETATTKFVGSVEIHLQVNQKNLRGTVTLPHGTGKKKTVLVFGDIAEQEGVIVGNEQTIDSIEKNKLVPGKDFQTVIAAPQFMPKIAKIARVLGPKGLMPNPKSGTVSPNLKETLNKFLAGQIEYKSEASAQLIHNTIGKTNFEDSQLIENFQTLIGAIGSTKVTGISINSTMGPGIKVAIK